MNTINTKGSFYFGVGSLLLVLLVFFVIIWLANKPLASNIVDGLSNLSSATGHNIKLP